MAIIENKKAIHRRTFWFGGVKHEVTAEAETMEDAEQETFDEQESMCKDWISKGVDPRFGLVDEKTAKAKVKGKRDAKSKTE